MASNLNFPEDQPKPLPLEYSNPLRKPMRIDQGPPEDVPRYVVRRVLFAIGFGLLGAGIACAYTGYDHQTAIFEMGLGSGLIALAWKPWRLGA